MEIKNQKIKLAWLAGIVDGEGSIGMKRTKDKRIGRSPMIYQPLIQITNCNFLLLKEVKSILDLLSIKYSFWKRIENRNPKWRDAGNISIASYESCINFLEVIIPFLISKKKHAKILLDFCTMRLRINHRGQGGKFKKTYTGKESIYWKRLHKLNYKGKRKYGD